MTFYNWIKTQTDNEAIGELALEILNDPDFPTNVASELRALAYLRRIDAEDECEDEMREAWRLYDKARVNP